MENVFESYRAQGRERNKNLIEGVTDEQARNTLAGKGRMIACIDEHFSKKGTEEEIGRMLTAVYADGDVKFFYSENECDYVVDLFCEIHGPHYYASKYYDFGFDGENDIARIMSMYVSSEASRNMSMTVSKCNHSFDEDGESLS